MAAFLAMVENLLEKEILVNAYSGAYQQLSSNKVVHMAGIKQCTASLENSVPYSLEICPPFCWLGLATSMGRGGYNEYG